MTGSVNKKASHISDSSFKMGFKDANEIKKDQTLKARLVVYFTYLLFFFYGYLHLMPTTFFNTASQYWMYKFRDPSSEEINADNKTTLQSYFQSASLAAQAVPGVVFMGLAAFYGHLWRASFRIDLSMVVLIAVFTASSIFVEINTDDWQSGFFGVAMLLLAINKGASCLFQISTMVVVGKFPSAFMRAFLLGQSGGEIFCALLQIISLAVTDKPTTSALIYFVTGTLLVVLTLVMSLIFRHTDLYDRYVSEESGQNKPQSLPLREVVLVSKKIWACLAIGLISSVAYTIIHPSITTLVVPENYGDGSAWTAKYFTPVIAFFYGETCGLIGRIFSWDFLTRSRSRLIVLFFTVISLAYCLLIMFCNAKPRNNLPVLFPHDYQYIIIFGTFQMFTNFVYNAVFMGVGRLSEGNEENSLKIMMLLLGVIRAVLSPIGAVVVSLL